MNITLPIYIEQRKSSGGSGIYLARPLFFSSPHVRGQELDRLLTKLAQDVGQELTGLGRLGRHDNLAAWTFAPRLSQQRLELTLTLRRRTARCRYLFVVFWPSRPACPNSGSTSPAMKCSATGPSRC
jgi:hypothetical protein